MVGAVDDGLSRLPLACSPSQRPRRIPVSVLRRNERWTPVFRPRFTGPELREER